MGSKFVVEDALVKKAQNCSFEALEIHKICSGRTPVVLL
jgi:hypothetical protein